MSSMHLSNCICGFHDYQAIWEPTHGEEVYCWREIGNMSDPYTRSIMKGRENKSLKSTGQSDDIMEYDPVKNRKR